MLCHKQKMHLPSRKVTPLFLLILLLTGALIYCAIALSSSCSAFVWICTNSRLYGGPLCARFVKDDRLQLGRNYVDRDKIEATIDRLHLVAETPFSQEYKAFQQDAVDNFDANIKLSHMLIKLLSTKIRREIRIAVVGGSSTVPHGIPTDRGYFALFCQWMAQAFSKVGANITCHNSALGATGSNYFARCVNDFLNLSNYDILLTEFALNDRHFADTKAPGYDPYCGSPSEELVRAALRRNPLLQIIVVNFTPLRHLLILDFPPKCPSPLLDNVYRDIAKRYGMTTIQYRHMFCGTKMNISNYSRKQLSKLAVRFVSLKDHVHASDKIHLALAEFLVGYFRAGVLQLMRRLRLVALGGSSLITDVIGGSEAVIKQQVAQLLHPATKPLYPTTRTDFDAECFIEIDWSFRRNVRLSTSLIDSSEDVTLWNGHNLDTLQVVRLANSNSFIRFIFNNLRKPTLHCKSYLPRLAFSSQLCNCTEFGKLGVTANFTISDGSVLRASYRVPLVVTGFKPHYLQHLTPNPSGFHAVSTSSGGQPPYFNEKGFCLKRNMKIESIDMRIEQLSFIMYPARITSIIVDYECCDLPSSGA